MRRMPTVPADRRFASKPVPPRPVRAGRHAHPRPRLDRGRRAGPRDRRRRHRRPRSTLRWTTQRDPTGAIEQRGAINGTVDAKDHGQSGRTTRQITLCKGATTSSTRDIDTRNHLAGSQQHRGGVLRRTADHVQAPVHAEDEVHVRQPGGAEHHLVTGGTAAVRVRGGVHAHAVVRLHLGQPHHHRSGVEFAAEQPARGNLHRPGEQPPKRFARIIQTVQSVQRGTTRSAAHDRQPSSRSSTTVS